MRKKHLLIATLTLVMTGCGNLQDKKQGGENTTSDTTEQLANPTAEHSGQGTDKEGIQLPTPLMPGAISNNYERDDEGPLMFIANLGHYESLKEMKDGHFWGLLCNLYPQIKNINELTVDNGSGDIWFFCPCESNMSMAINEYNMDMFMGTQDAGDGQIYFRTEEATPILVRTPMDDPGSNVVNAVSENGTVMEWLPTQEPQTNKMRKQEGVEDITYNPIFNFVEYGDDYQTSVNGDKTSIRFYADRQMYINEQPARYFCYPISLEEMMIYIKVDGMECLCLLDNTDFPTFSLTVKQGKMGNAEAGTKLDFTPTDK